MGPVFTPYRGYTMPAYSLPYGQPKSEPVYPRSPAGGWKMQAQWGANHTLLTPTWGWSQRGAADSIVVPNDELGKFNITQGPRQAVFAIPIDPYQGRNP